MKKLVPVIPFLFAIAVIVGCGPKDVKATSTTTTGTTTGTTTPEDEPEVVKSDKDDVSAELRHAGYEYYGLGNTQPMVYDFEFNGTVEEGKQQVKYQGMVDGVPTYKIERTGALSQMSSETVKLRPEGVFISETGLGPMDTEVKALEANLEVGKSWETSNVVTRADGNVTMKSSYKVEAQKKITTPAGEYDCLVIKSTGTVSTSEKTEKFTGTLYVAKGVGTVKLVINANDQNGKPTENVITLKAIE